MRRVIWHHRRPHAPTLTEAHVVEVDPDRGVVDLRAEALSLNHLMAHLPKNPFCEACRKAKAIRTQKRKKVDGYKPTMFGEQTTADHLVAGWGGSAKGLRRSQGRGGYLWCRNALAHRGTGGEEISR